MLVYNVTVNVEEEKEQDWLEWMRREHIPDLLNTGCFQACRLSRLLDAPSSSGISFSVQYESPDREHYERYLADHAGEMRRRGLERFGNAFQAFRTVMEVVDEQRKGRPQ